jgi:protein ImuB
VALAVIEKRGPAEVLACLSPAAEALGLTRGQPLAEARALAPGLVTRPADPRGRRSFWPRSTAGPALCALGAVDGADGLVLDITGAAHLMGGEAALAADLRARLGRAGFTARLGLAPTRGAAWALARFARDPVTLAEEARAAIDPAAAGRPAPAARNRRGAVAAGSAAGARSGPHAPRALIRRFGPELALRLDQAVGAVAEPVDPAPPPAPFAVRLTLPEPIGLTADVMAALSRLLDRLCDRLADAGRGARHLRLELARADGSRAEAAVTLARPMREPAAIAALFDRAVAALDAGFGFDALRLSAPGTEPMAPAQLSAAQARHGPAAEADALADLLTRLGNRLGLEALSRFLPADSHIPERAFQIASAIWTEAPPAWPAGSERPLILFAPEPLPGLTGPTPPRRFTWRRRRLTTLAARGPERIAPEWWLDDPAWRTGLRDYWRIDTAEGPRLWLFHTPQAPGWAVQGNSPDRAFTLALRGQRRQNGPLAPWLNWIEQPPPKGQVAGSNPAGVTISRILWTIFQSIAGQPCPTPPTGRAACEQATSKPSELRRDDAGVEPAHAQLAVKPLILDLRAAVLHEVEPARARHPEGRLALDADLQPDGAQVGQDRDRLLDHRRHLFGTPEDVDHVGLIRTLLESGPHRLAEQPLARMTRIDRDHAIALQAEIAADVMAGSDRVGRDANDGDAARPLQKAAQRGVVGRGVDGFGHGRLRVYPNREWNGSDPNSSVTRARRRACWSP